MTAEAKPGAFSAGLLHDVGRLALAAAAAAAYPAISQRARDEEMVLAAERLIFHEDHAEAGGRILDAWQLPAEIIEAVTLHHAEQKGELHEGLRYARRLAAEAGYTDGLARAFETPVPPVADITAISALHARVEWYRSAIRGGAAATAAPGGGPSDRGHAAARPAGAPRRPRRS